MLWTTFISRGARSTSHELSKIPIGEVKDALKVLVVRDMKSKAEHGYAVEAVVVDVLWMGYSRLILKSDNEPAILKVVEGVRKRLKQEKLEIV